MVFDRFDRDRSGKIDSEELKEALRSLGYALPPSVMQIIMSNYIDSASGRGGLNFDNFVEYVSIFHSYPFIQFIVGAFNPELFTFSLSHL